MHIPTTARYAQAYATEAEPSPYTSSVQQAWSAIAGLFDRHNQEEAAQVLQVCLDNARDDSMRTKAFLHLRQLSSAANRRLFAVRPAPQGLGLICTLPSHRDPRAASALRGQLSLTLQATDLRGVNLAGLNLAGINFQGVNLKEADLRSTILDDANLQQAWMKGTDLTGASLRHANLSNATLQGAILIKANLTGAVMVKVNLISAHLYRAILTGANLTEAAMWLADFVQATLQRTNLTQANFQDAKLHQADFRKANFTDTILRDAYLHDADLRDITQSGTDFSTAFLKRAKQGHSLPTCAYSSVMPPKQDQHDAPAAEHHTALMVERHRDGTAPVQPGQSHLSAPLVCPITKESFTKEDTVCLVHDLADPTRVTLYDSIALQQWVDTVQALQAQTMANPIAPAPSPVTNAPLSRDRFVHPHDVQHYQWTDDGHLQLAADLTRQGGRVVAQQPPP